ncbi:hypothetical protein ACFLIM_05730 [Nonomuraea sp. M3C6]|uniref:Ferredoxin n=1 Tax=Nonomuraea marmarensis TaxID=3351344 RepID=A0ABW7A6M8_9ACTN
MKIIIEQDKCVASGQCVLAAEDVFDQRDEDGIVVLLNDDPSPKRLPDPAGLPRYIHLAETGQLDLASMVSKRITLDQVNEGIELLERGEGVRTVIV